MNQSRSNAPASASLIALLWVLLPILAPASEETPINDMPSRIAAIEALNAQIDRAVMSINKEDRIAALPLLKNIIESAAFEYLPLERRRALLLSASGVALQLNEHRLAQTYARRVCALPNPPPIVWPVRLYASYNLDDWSDAALALTQIAKKDPGTLKDLNDDTVFRIVHELKNSPADAASSFDLMAALFAANWKMEGMFEPSYIWRDYAIALVERRKLAEAKRVVMRVQQPGLLISVRVDKRFDAIVKSSPEIIDIDKAVESEISSLRNIVQGSPRSMQAVIQLTYALLKARHYEEVLALTDEVMQKAERGAGDKPVYDDADKLIWILNNRAIAFGGLGQRDEELELLIRAARRPEHGESNVSQAINLGEFYCDSGRPKDALFAILDAENVSPYGKTQIENVHLCAGLQLGDKEAVASALSYLKEHLTDSPNTYQAVLIDVQDFDGAAAILISRLNDPSLRADALAEVQNYIDPTDLSWPVQSHNHFQAVINRPDVHKVITKFGRIESFNLRSDLN
jgi:tetratricopeptide (TPR) repeat protein